ncbi:MAG: hypothetical protein NUW09_01450, partial [Deltaproteobacteria bacterium]|nr:hypothetical protein [Deltaproteobacteria bacterium]
PEAQAEDAAVQQAMEDHAAAQEQLQQEADTHDALTTPDPATGKPVVDMSRQEFTQAALASNPEADIIQVGEQYDEVMSEAKDLNLVDDRHLSEINDPDLQAIADVETAPSEFDLTEEPSEAPSSTIPSMKLEEAQAKFPGLNEEQHKSMVKDAIDTYAIDEKAVQYPDMKAYAQEKATREQTDQFVKDELARQMQDQGYVTPILNMLGKAKLNRPSYEKIAPGDIDREDMRGYWSKGGLSISDATQRAWQNGWISENNEAMFVDAVNDELYKKGNIATEGIGGEILGRMEGEPQRAPSYMEQGAEYNPISPAIRDPQTGQVFTGPSHAEIVKSITDAGISRRVLKEFTGKTGNTGFMDSDGKFITRDEAQAKYGFSTSEELNAMGGKPFMEKGAEYRATTPEFKAWFGKSKDVPEMMDNGQPIILYHGSDKVFTEFNPDKLGSNTGAQSAKKGFFLSSSPRNAGFYAGFSEAQMSDFYGRLAKERKKIQKENPKLDKEEVGQKAWENVAPGGNYLKLTDTLEKGKKDFRDFVKRNDIPFGDSF